MRVNVDSKALADQRFTRLGVRLKINRHEALGRCVPVWMAAYENRSPLMNAGDVDALADLRGFAKALLAVDLATSLRGKLRLRGVDERIEFLLVQDAKREKALAEKRRLAGLPGKRPGGRSVDGKQPRNHSVPGDVPGHGPYSPDQDQPLAPDLDPEARAVAEQAASPAPVGWKPPAGGKAEAEASRRIAAGELSPSDRDACWEYLRGQGIASDPPAKQDARAVGAIRKQRPTRADDNTAGSYEERPW